MQHAHVADRPNLWDINISTLEQADGLFGAYCDPWDADEAPPSEPRAALLHTLWAAFDATSAILVRHGDGDLQTVDLTRQQLLVGTTLSLGTFTVDLAASEVAVAAGQNPHVPMSYVVDGIRLDIAFCGASVDVSQLAYDAILSHAASGGGLHVRVDGVDHGVFSGAILADDEGVLDLGGAYRFDSDAAPCLHFVDGVLEGMDLEGRRLRIELIQTLRAAA